jgi:prepilin-type N-terminal cleavage/methylation domain-containing protein/prepilin-type processing-associated H-X9-DG protein
MQHRRGFTLIELLVVIAVIAIIAAILFPVFAQAREKARQSMCVSNMKQIGTGLMMYQQDYDETYPFGYQYFGTYDAQGNCTATNQLLVWWQDLLRPYVRNEAVYTCPSARAHVYWDTLRPPGLPNPLVKDYVANGIFGVPPSYPQAVTGLSLYLPKQLGGRGPMFGNGGCGGTPVRLAQVAEPAGTIGICDANNFELFTLAQTDAWPVDRCDRGNCCVGVYGAAFRCALTVALRHNGGFAATYLDGHAKWIRQSKPGEWTIEADPLDL